MNNNDHRLAEAIISDIDQSEDLIAERSFSSVYFGGGTPSLSSVESIKKILDVVKNRLEGEEAEITFEMNPNDVSRKKIDGLLMAGVNRISLGVQSYHDQELKALGRSHDSGSILEAKKILKDTNTTIDLMYGIENQTSESFTSNLKKFLSSDINHLSLYQLTIEPNTIFYKKELFLPKEKDIERMEAIATELLEQNGFQQYEVSSWSRPGYESQHNLNYWHFGDFLGVGPGSHSKISNDKKIVRYRKIKPLEGYIKNQKTTDLKTIVEDDLDLDIAMNLLRMKNGLEQRDLSIKLPKSFFEKYKKGISEGLLLKDKIGTTKKGYKFLNETIQLFF